MDHIYDTLFTFLDEKVGSWELSLNKEAIIKAKVVIQQAQVQNKNQEKYQSNLQLLPTDE